MPLIYIKQEYTWRRQVDDVQKIVDCVHLYGRVGAHGMAWSVLLWRHHVAIDVTVSDGKLYWCGDDSRTIGSINTDGSDRLDLFSAPTADSLAMYGITVLHDRIFISNWGSEEGGR